MRRKELLKRFTSLQSELSKLGQALAQDDADGASYRDTDDADAPAWADLAGQDGFEPARESDDGLPLFPSKEAAENAANFTDADCNGAHRMEVDGDTFWMPCSDHDTAQQAFGSASDCPDCPDADADADADADPDGDADADSDVDADQPDDVFADVALEASVTGTVSIDRDQADATGGVLEANDADGLVGIIWGAGDHDLHLGGEGAAVHVPQDTIEPTFQALQEDVDAGQVEIGLDHADDDSVLAQSGLREIGVADDVAMAADDRNIVLTDSSFTSEQAMEAHESGDFDSFDFSVVADVAIRTDDDGNRVTTDGGRVVLDATRITRIDVVQEGAVDAASVGRVPELRAGLETVQQVATNPNQNPAQDAVQALQASANALGDFSKTNTDTDMNDPNIDPSGVDDLEAAREQLSAAADVIDDQTDTIDSLEAQATAFEDVASAHGVDVDDYDDVEAAAQAVVDEQTEDIRADIARIEDDLPSFDVDDVEARQDELSGKSKDELSNLLNARKADKLDAMEAQQNKGRAASQSDQSSGRNAALSGGQSGSSADADEVALEAMGGRDRIEQQASDKSPAAFVREKYGVEAGDFEDAGEVNDAIIDATQGDA